MLRNPWLVLGTVALAYALWRAWAPRPASSADASTESADASSASPTGILQSLSNAFGAVLVAGGFEDAAGVDLDDQDADQDDSSGGDAGEALYA